MYQRTEGIIDKINTFYKNSDNILKSIQEEYFADNNRSADKKKFFSVLAEELSFLSIDKSFDVDLALCVMLTDLESTNPVEATALDDHARVRAWFDALLFGEFNFSEQIVKKYSSGRPTDEIKKKELLPV